MNKIKTRSDELDAKYDGAFYGMTKQDAIEARTLSLFEGYDMRTDEVPNPNPHKYQYTGYLMDITRILEGGNLPYYYVSKHAFEYWYARKQGIVKDYWDF